MDGSRSWARKAVRMKARMRPSSVVSVRACSTAGLMTTSLISSTTCRYSVSLLGK